MENIINTLGICAVIALVVIIITGLWLIITSKKGEEFERFAGLALNVIPAFLGGLIDAIIGKFIPTYTEMVVMLIGVIAVNVVLVIVFWPWKSGESFNF